MICKKCQQEMPEIGAFCPFCGEPKALEEELLTDQIAEGMEDAEQSEILEETEMTEETEALEEAEETASKKHLKLWQLIAIIAGGVVLLGVLAGAVLYALGVDLKPRANDLYYKDSYTAADEKIEKAADKVIATLGDKELTLADLQLYYTNNIYTLINQYYSYVGYVPVDLTIPLDQQSYPMSEDGQTWQQYFLDAALSEWRTYAVLQTLMEQEGYVPSETLQADLDNMESEIESIAVSCGYENAQAYLDEQMSPGITMDIYMQFNEIYYTANEYLEQCYVALAPTAEEIDAYYQENQQTFTDNGVAPDMGLHSSVRHILIQPEGGTEDEEGNVTYSEEEQAAAYAEAERILEEWKAGDATEESFAELANTYSADGGSNTTGGLYEDINIDASYVEEFRAWAVDAARQVGDTAIVETQFGYHIMYFVSGEDYFTYTVREQLVAQRVQEKLLAAQEAYPMEVNYKKILLYTPDFS